MQCQHRQGLRVSMCKKYWLSVFLRVAKHSCVCCAALPSTLKMTPSGICAGRPTLPTSFKFDGQSFDVVLRLRPESSPFTLDGALMDKYARKATELRRLEHDAEKVHAMLRHAMLVDLVVEAGRPGRPDLSFRQWLAGNGILSLTTRQRPGPIVPEVYDCLDQVIYDGLGFPRVVPTTQVLTSFQSTMLSSMQTGNTRDTHQ
ncbi:hypothetical protein DUNSADRAFT_1315 [Dunaliella salina]|uniref:Encoded protein n=1 Tax=Dunaliella salina TaxID=3046 RepID=A0ABQ7FXN3_DUNSA|nr:hypothetical protein DUNSADRAFT_1315 [Dunaliella salina]|eukprot:KAF5827109.1 hypothetical protein DUNSADRAFT_1315 [Dunaliella salina]